MDDTEPVRAEDGCRLWTDDTGHGKPLILCHGGPGLWDMFGAVATVLSARMRVIRWDQRGCGRSERREAEDRELAVLQWSADFADPATARGYAEQLADPWFGINYECNAAITAEERQVWRETELVTACRGLAVPTLIVDGAQDIRPRWAVDSLQEALPSATRVVLPHAGHVPWLEAPDEFRTAVVNFLCPA
ncbi:proline iminopeptidase [Amycolatopsis bartoniae]|uniref:AB hydrolase-1 domain-containing protein n=1 Tax=Amycolatopsis bartoniae TaxID=941986 RepID=A0A8H9M3C7_9PSEU|nr:alpha/beta hydrolase [Amycolatopsis bartoniae]MBB2939286.1 proline iminopeptidase [Amycolatopsis bartoniae]TVT08742.1 alpha/beta fold hydrolase [Amycolatopsis bartoniae]GHF37574.1 hypothetical protein GCM10017566_08450 [Amycolatopsis bartoniae]